MAKQIFKGFRQVSATQFNAAKDANLLSGYMWFVRTEVSDEGTNNIANDEYDIYFGSRHYGHFCEGELTNIKSQIETLNGNVNDILEMLNSLTTLSGQNADAIEKNVKDIQANATAIEDVKTNLQNNFLVKNVDANDKVLSVADGILSSAISLKYESNRISLIGKDNAEIAGFDASDFVKDSVLEDVKVETRENEKYIVFTWKTEGEETKTDEIKVSDFAKLYEAGTGLELAADGVTFNVKVAENDNFLSVNANNELIVDDMTVDKTKIKEAITIEGGPLASDAVKAAFEGGVIPAGADIQSVLKALLCVEIYPVPTKNTPSYSASISTPSITEENGVKHNDLVEIGQKLSFKTVSSKGVSVSKTNPIVSGFEHGYSTTIDGDVNEGTSISAEWTVSQKENNVYELSASKTNFTGDVPATVTGTTGCTLAACELTAVLGTNTYTVTEDAPKQVGSHPGVASAYIVSNLGGRSEDKKSVAIDAESNVEVDPANKTATFTVTGVYPVFNNMVSTTASNTVDVDKKMTLSSGNQFEISYGPETNAFHAFAYPATHSLSTVEIYNTMSKAYEGYSGGSSTTDATYSIQGVDTAYKVWKRAGNAYSETTKFRFTLNKSLNK